MTKKKIPLEIPKLPARAAVPDEVAERFIASGETASAPPVTTEPQKSRARPKGSKLRREETGERLQAYIPSELEKALRMYCAVEKCSRSYVITEALLRYPSLKKFMDEN